LLRAITHSVVVFLIIACFTIPTIADEIVLKNGDRISGRTTRLQDGKLTIETDYAETVVVDWDQVIMLKTDTPLHVTFPDGTSRKTSALFYREGMDADLPEEEAGQLERIEAGRVAGLSVKPGPRVKISTNVNAGLSQERGNTDTDTYYVNADLVARSQKQRFTFVGELSNEKTDGVNTSESWQAIGKYDYFLSPKWFLYGSALFENDRFADLNLRSTLGAGGGYQIFESDPLNLSIALGPSYVNEDFIAAEDDDYFAAQWILNYDQAFFDKLFQLFHSDLATVGLEDIDQWQVKTRQGLRFFLYKGLTWTLQYNYDYNNSPSEAAEKKWDSKLLFLLGYQFNN
jgi:putative salt-induced outer membrane protein YdiY